MLIHDEDYCDHPEDEPPPPQDRCQQLNVDAADADVNAAYFMSETHNQANATAWMLGTDQMDRSTGADLWGRTAMPHPRYAGAHTGADGRRAAKIVYC